MELELNPQIGHDNYVFQGEEVGNDNSPKGNPEATKEDIGNEVKVNSGSPSDKINEINAKKYNSNTNNVTNTASTTWATTVMNNNDKNGPNDGQISFNKTSYGYDNDRLKHQSPNGKSDDDNASDEESQTRKKDNKTSNKDNTDFSVKRKRSAAVSYETIVWIVFFVLTIAILIDRFTGNGDRIFEKKGRF